MTGRYPTKGQHWPIVGPIQTIRHFSTGPMQASHSWHRRTGKIDRRLTNHKTMAHHWPMSGPAKAAAWPTLAKKSAGERAIADHLIYSKPLYLHFNYSGASISHWHFFSEIISHSWSIPSYTPFSTLLFNVSERTDRTSASHNSSSLKRSVNWARRVVCF